MAQNDGLSGNPSIAIWPQNSFQWQLFTQQLYTSNLQSGMSAYLTGQPGYFIGYTQNYPGIADGTPVLSVGNPSGHYMAWDGTELTVVGNIEATSGTFSGGIVLGTGSSISSGQTAYNTGVGFWLGTDASGNPQFSMNDSTGDFLQFNAAGSGIIKMSSPLGITGVLTSLSTDDAGLGNTADWGGLSSVPTGVQNAIAAVTVQPNLGTASGTQTLFQTGGGTPFWANQYGFNFNSGYSTLANTTLALNSFTLVGNEIQLPNPGGLCTIFVVISGQYISTGTVTVAPAFQGQIGISTNGGGTFTFGPTINLNSTIAAADNFPFAGTFCIPNVTPTGNIVIKFEAEYTVGTTTGSFSCNNGSLNVFMIPVANFSIVTGPLSVVVPSTQTTNCTSTYPTTTCAALSNITATPSGGTPPYTYSWSRTGGTGAGVIVSGATSITVNVSDTETGSVGGTSYTDIYKCIVTDSLSATANASCTVTSTFYLVYNAIVPSMSATGGQCNTGSSPGTCNASATFTVSATGGNGSYTYSNSITSQTGGYSATITSGATSSSGTYGGSHATASGPPGNVDTVNFQSSVNDTRGTGAQIATASANLRYYYI